MGCQQRSRESVGVKRSGPETNVLVMFDVNGTWIFTSEPKQLSSVRAGPVHHFLHRGEVHGDVGRARVSPRHAIMKSLTLRCLGSVDSNQSMCCIVVSHGVNLNEAGDNRIK